MFPFDDVIMNMETIVLNNVKHLEHHGPAVSGDLAQGKVSCPNILTQVWRTFATHKYGYPTAISGNSGQSTNGIAFVFISA